MQTYTGHFLTALVSFPIGRETTQATGFLGSKSDMGCIRGAIRSTSMSVQPVHAEETCSCAAVFSRDDWFAQIPPKHPSDNPDGTSALQTAETFSP